MSEPFALPSQAIDIAGARFGSLVAVRPTWSGRLGVRWECRCDCGRVVERLCATLRSGTGRAACDACNKDLTRQRMARRSILMREVMRKTWEQTGSPYAFRGVDDLDPLPLTAAPRARLEHDDTGGEEPIYIASGSQLSQIVPMSAADEHEFECDDCGKRFAVGFGCLTCTQPVCQACVHDCSCNPSGCTFERIGRELGVGIERVRQIEAKALRKLRHPSRSGGLKDFIDGR